MSDNTLYTVIITHRGGEVSRHSVDAAAAQRARNINEVVFTDYVRRDQVKRIEVEQTGPTGAAYINRTYDAQLEAWKNERARIEAVNKPGHEDLTGTYGTRTGGKRSRFYIGKSMGWLPVYLAIDNARSAGGPIIMFSGIESIRRIR